MGRKKITCEKCESKFEFDEDLMHESEFYNTESDKVFDAVDSVKYLDKMYFKTCPTLKKYEDHYDLIGDFEYRKPTFKCPICGELIDLDEYVICDMIIFDGKIFGNKSVSLTTLYELDKETLPSKNPNIKIRRVLCEQYDESMFDEEY